MASVVVNCGLKAVGDFACGLELPQHGFCRFLTSFRDFACGLERPQNGFRRSLTLFRDFACGLRRPQNGFRRSLTLFRDFACGLRRPQNGSTCSKDSQPLHWKSFTANTFLEALLASWATARAGRMNA